MNRRRFIVPLTLAIVTLCSAVASEAATRARARGQTVINDAPVRVAAGNLHTCQIKEDGTVRCWGANFFGQLGNGTTVTPIAPVPVTGVSAAVAVAAGSFFTCALIVDGSVRCWGDNGAGQLGAGSTAGLSTAALAVTGLSNAVVLAAGSQHACALRGDGTVRCWGANGSGQLGDGTTTTQSTPVIVNGVSNAVGLAAGASHTCAVLSDGTARCWGDNGAGQLGNSSTVMPVTVVALSTAVAITARNLHTCALLANGTVRCWGSNTSGQLGNGTTTGAQAPTSVSGLANAVSVTAGNLHTCAALASGIGACWGNNGSGQLGDGTAERRLKPVQVSTLANAVALAAGTEHSCAVLADGSARCWGAHLFAQLGNNTVASSVISPKPTPVAGGGGSILVRGIATGEGHTCVVRASSAVSCWGYNYRGQVGDGTSLNDRLTPVTINFVPNAVAVAAGDLHSCALLAGGGVRCWGANDNRQLGDGTDIDRLTPFTVSGLTNAVAIAGGYAHTCALLADGTVRCWGSNGSGQLGDGTSGNFRFRSTPFPVIGITNAVAIAVGTLHSCALLVGGSVRCWGLNSSGQLGDGTRINFPSPVTVSGLANAVAIAAGSGHTCALLANGGARCWGDNGFGELGDGTTTDQLSPVTDTGLTNAVAIAAIGSSGTQDPTCALVADGGARCWGRNEYGQVGDGTTTTRLSPTTVTTQIFTIIGTLGGTTRIATGNTHTCVVQASGRVLCWGDNSNGQLGDGTRTTRLRPQGTLPVLSIRLNIDPQVTLDDDVREATVTVLASCEDGQELQLDVVLTQGTVTGRGSSVEACVGGLARYPITVLAPSGAAFRSGPATVQADAIIVENGTVVETQQWTRAVNVVGTDGSLEGSASGIGSGTDNGSARVSGQFTAEESLSLDQATVTVTALLLESGGAGELVRGAVGAALLPLTLTARAGSTPTAAIYQTPSGVRPVVRAEMKSRDPDTGIVEFSIAVDRATMPAGPTLCSGGQTPTTSLRTRFSLHADGATVDLDLTVPWRCLGTQLRTP